MKTSSAIRLHCVACMIPRAFVLLVVLVLLPQCAFEIPGCGPGEIPSNPINSNLIEYTVPASGLILRPSTFNNFRVVFLVRIRTNTFSVSDDMGMCWIDTGESECNPEGDHMVDPESVFKNPTWTCSNQDECDRLELVVDSGPLVPIEPFSKRYMIRFFKNGQESPIESAEEESHRLEDHVDIHIKIVPDSTETDRPYVGWINPLPYHPYVAPHQRLTYTFTDEMGFINIVAHPLWGLNFLTETGKVIYHDKEIDVTKLHTESIQGLNPGDTYKVWFLSEDDTPQKVPFTMDQNGNSLRPHPFSAVDYFVHIINISHVGIFFPIHTPFSSEPDNWFVQLGSDYKRPYFQVHVSSIAREDNDNLPIVAQIRSTDPDGLEGDISFETKDVEEIGESFIIYPSINHVEEDGSLFLEVHAYDGVGSSANYLGYDKLLVSSIPLPDSWLSKNPLIADAIVWEYENGVQRKWSDWSSSRKSDIREAFWKIKNWFRRNLAGPEPLSLVDPPENIWWKYLYELYPDEIPEGLNSHPWTVLSPEDAWSLYIGYVAWTLVLEIFDVVPWSLLDFEDFQNSVSELLDGRLMFLRTGAVVPGLERYGYLIYDEDSGRIVPAPPTYTYKILTKDIDISSMETAIEGVLGFCRDNLGHSMGPNTYERSYNHWQYFGYPPVSKIIEGTAYCEYDYSDPGTPICPDSGHFGHWTAGCHGTVGFIRALLRTLNIPVRVINIGPEEKRHSQAYFPEIDIGLTDDLGAYLPHGDNPYNTWYKYHKVLPDTGVETISPLELLIDHAKYELWFENDDMCEESMFSNMARRVAEIAVQHMTTLAMKVYCWDIRENNVIDFSTIEQCNHSCLCRSGFKLHIFALFPGCLDPDKYGLTPLTDDWNGFINDLGDRILSLGWCTALDGIEPSVEDVDTYCWRP